MDIYKKIFLINTSAIDVIFSQRGIKYEKFI